jgi:hypothetical protein
MKNVSVSSPKDAIRDLASWRGRVDTIILKIVM